MTALKVENYRAFFIDLDGVLVRSSTPLPGVDKTLRKLKKNGQVIIFSNNSILSRKTLSHRLNKKGLHIEPEEIVNSAYVVARYLSDIAGPTGVFVIGEDGIKDELKLAGHRLVKPEEAKYLVVGMDRQISYQKLSQALKALRKGAVFIASNADPVFPTLNGIIPGAGSMVGAIEGMGYPPKKIVGKPSSTATKIAMETAGVCNPDECLIIGDRIDTDIAAARKMRMHSSLVLTGVTRREDLKESDIQPTWVMENLTSLLE